MRRAHASRRTPASTPTPLSTHLPAACCKAARAEEEAAVAAQAGGRIDSPSEAPLPPAAARRHGGGAAAVATAPALLASYQPERQWHLDGVTLVALVIGRLVMLSSPTPLRIARNWVVGALYHCPLTRPFFKVRREVEDRGERGGRHAQSLPPPSPSAYCRTPLPRRHPSAEASLTSTRPTAAAAGSSAPPRGAGGGGPSRAGVAATT